MTRKDILKKLDQHGVMPTAQRVEVAKILLSRPQHVSADQIIDKLSSHDSTRKFYDSTTHPHHHFFHVDTGKLTDIPEAQVSIGGLPPLPAGTETESVEVLIRVRGKRR